MTKSGSGWALLTGWLVAIAAGASVFVGCSSPAPAHDGALMLAVSTDMRAPKDVNAIAVAVSSNGVVLRRFIGRVTPEGEVQLPATFAITEADVGSASVRIRIMAFKDRKARVMRDVRTTLPRDRRTALLRIPMNFVNEGSALGDALPEGVLPAPSSGKGLSTSAYPLGEVTGAAAGFDFFAAFQPPCPDIVNQTIIDGVCADSAVDSQVLPDFVDEREQLGVSTDVGSCFDLATCFAPSAADGETMLPPDREGAPAGVTLDASACTLALGAADPSALNLALVTTETGECIRAGECYIPIDRGPAGWEAVEGKVQLPRYVCSLIAGRNVRLATSTGRCAAKLESNPVCAPDVTSIGSPDAGPAPVPLDGGSALPAQPDAGGEADGGSEPSVSCAPGERIDGRACVPCDAMTFSVTGNGRTCPPWSVCAPGAFVSVSGTSTSDRGCAACPPSSFSTAENAPRCAPHESCPSGTEQILPGTPTAANVCVACDQGTYCPGGATAKTFCVAAWDDDANAATECRSWTTCPAGTRVSREPTALADRGCEPCGAATFGTQTNALACSAWTTCQSGTYVSTAGTNHNDRECSACRPDQTSAPNATACFARAVEIVAGLYHTCARLNDGTVRCWGDNAYGQLGDGTNVRRLAPVAVPNLTNVGSIGAGAYHTCARLTDGTMRCWGFNDGGQLGDGTTENRASPVVVVGLTDAVDAVGGIFHTCARITDGTVRCWGRNTMGQLGDGTNVDRSAPTALPGLSGVAQLASGNYHGCALLTDGTARCWGMGTYGSIGDGTTEPRNVPTAVNGVLGGATIAAGNYTTCVGLMNGTARCWGYNYAGCLGDGTETDRSTAVPVVGLTAVIDMASSTHTCAARTDGTVHCWGDGLSGELGDGTTQRHFLPAPVIGLEGVTAVVNGQGHTCALLSNGTVRCWGRGDHVGDGDSDSNVTPSAPLVW